MGYYVSHMIGVRTGGVFSGGIVYEDFKKRVAKIAKEVSETDPFTMDLDVNDPGHCMSKELEAHKGSYVVIAGVFNYWKGDSADEFCKRLSKEFGTEVMHMEWNEETDEVRNNIWLDGKKLDEVGENFVGKIIRRVT